jgi:nitrate reductase NapE
VHSVNVNAIGEAKSPRWKAKLISINLTGKTPAIACFSSVPVAGTIVKEALRTNDNKSRARRMEIYAFLIVTAVVMPALAVATVGTYGLSVWVYQLIAGPPGPPSK